MTISWKSAMSVGNDAIDSDHQNLIKIINKIEKALDSSSDSQSIIINLQELEKYTVEHFAREENIMKKIVYPKRFEHFKQHYDLTNQLKEIKSKIINTRVKKNQAVIEDEIIEMLRQWLLNHVLQHDIQIKPYLSNYPSEYR